MVQVKVRTPRFTKAVDAALSPKQMVGDAAIAVAKQNAIHADSATFALDGRQIDPEERVETRIRRGDKLDLVLGF